jgi:hypothetical protein
MGTGEQIRGDAGGAPRRRAKGLRQWGREVRVVDLPEDIRAALAPS